MPFGEYSQTIWGSVCLIERKHGAEGQTPVFFLLTIDSVCVNQQTAAGACKLWRTRLLAEPGASRVISTWGRGAQSLFFKLLGQKRGFISLVASTQVA